MKYLGIDFGAKRIGIALSDEEGRLAFPHSVISNTRDLVEEVSEVIEREKINEIVLGESKDYKGQPNKIMADIEKFKKELEERIGLKINFEPEFMTSSQAKLIQGENKMHDASAAALILQSYLDKINNKNVAS